MDSVCLLEVLTRIRAARDHRDFHRIRGSRMITDLSQWQSDSETLEFSPQELASNDCSNP